MKNLNWGSTSISLGTFIIIGYLANLDDFKTWIVLTTGLVTIVGGIQYELRRLSNK